MRVSATVAGAAALLVVGAAIGGAVARSGSHRAQIVETSLKDSCGADVLFVGVRGSGETTEGAGLGDTNYAVEHRLSTLPRPINVVAEPVDYPAVNIFTRVVASGAEGIDVYRQSETSGEEQLINTLYLWHHKCPNYRFVISGYSQGAHAVGNVMTTLAKDTKDANIFHRIAGAVLFGDPIYNPKDPIAVAPPNRTQVGVMASYLGATSGPRPVYQPPLKTMIRSWCAAGDPICSSYPPTAAAQLAACGIPHAPCSHLRYVDGATDEGARFLADRVRATTAAEPGPGATRPKTNPPADPPGAPATPAGRDCVAFASDVTVPDGTTARGGQTLEKTWRLRNCGTTNWAGLTAVRTAGSFGPGSFPVPTTPPGATADVTVTVKAPLTPGRARVTYRLRAQDGHYADHEIWIEILVAAKAPPATPQPPPPGDGQIPPSDDPGQPPLPAGAHRLGPIDLNRYCDAWGRHATLRFPNTWGWRCSTGTVQADGNRVGDQNISADDACIQQYGAGATPHYADYARPDSWSCWAT